MNYQSYNQHDAKFYLHLILVGAFCEFLIQDKTHFFKFPAEYQTKYYISFFISPTG